MSDYCSNFTPRVGYEFLLKRIDREWIQHKLQTDDIPIPPKEIPDQQETELNYLLEADETRWQDTRPPNFCFEHRHCTQDSVKARFIDESVREQLISSLEDGTVFSILESLTDLQTLRENELWQKRGEEIAKIISINGTVSDEQIRAIDQKIVIQIEQIAQEQQCTLIASGLELFCQSNDPEEMRFQMAIIQFILTLGNVYEHQHQI